MLDKEYNLIRQRVFELTGERKLLTRQAQDEAIKLSHLQDEEQHIAKARVVIQQVAEETQRHLERRLSVLVSMALAAVFEDPYELSVKFEQKRGRTECQLQFIRNGKALDPMTASGGGVKDVAAFAARAAFWSLEKKGRAVMILDEPFCYLHGIQQQQNVTDMLQELSQKLGMQMIIVSDQSDIVGDKTFDIKGMVG